MLAQSEHDKAAKGLVVTTSEDLGKAIMESVEKQLSVLDTEEIARSSWNDFGEILIAKNLDEAVAYANEYAPEHLEVNVAAEDEDYVVNALHNYGSQAAILQKFSVTMRQAQITHCRHWGLQNIQEAYGLEHS